MLSILVWIITDDFDIAFENSCKFLTKLSWISSTVVFSIENPYKDRHGEKWGNTSLLIIQVVADQ
jgi:hypothetical protein